MTKKRKEVASVPRRGGYELQKGTIIVGALINLESGAIGYQGSINSKDCSDDIFFADDADHFT